MSRYIQISIDENNLNQKNEIGDIKWVTFEEGYRLIREYHKEKKNILFNTHQFVKNLILHFNQLYENFYKKNKNHYTF